METRLSGSGNRNFYTTDSVEDFNSKASVFFGEPVSAMHVDLK
jgi:glutamate racemase